jgi:ATP-dependent helicase HrpA
MPRRPSSVVQARTAVRFAARQEARAQLPNPLPYPDDLPITARKDEIIAALGVHQVVVVAGETGSGKSTQLPKICVEAGRGLAGMIGHSQPRRIAARSVGERVAEELGATFGGAVGYKVRFTDRVSDKTLIKLMTDGVLLAELHGDPSLRAYDTLIIDEAHERSLNIDFILGYLRRLLTKRPDLKVIITSATIDTERFSRHFGDAPVIEVSGRAYPVEIRYRPIDEDEDDGDPDGEMSGGPGGDVVDEIHAVCDAVGELCREGSGDILVFLAGEREIRDTADALSKADLRGLEILPLFGRLSSADQHRIFEAHSGRRVVLATNVAETSLTVPGIRYVVDPGTARISRYSRRTKVQRLPIEQISQASANQRAGRCGRLGPGICVRLYSDDNFAARRPFTEPEILRTNLASVILQMAAIGLGPIEDFPFIDPPDRRNIKDGITLLEELGALAPSLDEVGRVGAIPVGAGPVGAIPIGASPVESEGWRLTAMGRKLAKLPLDPRLGCMVLEAARFGCLEDVLIIVAGLAVQDPRERPADKRDAAAALHGRFDDQGSDFLSYLALWDYLDDRQNDLSSSQFRRLCRRELISYQRAREWQDVHAQLAEICGQLGLVPGRREPGGLREARKAQVHQALLSGLATQVGAREGERTDFAAPRGARFAIWPGSVLAKKPPRWVMAAELVETSRLWARVAAPVRPQWVERAASHLLRWSYSEPQWDVQRAEGVVLARATLYGLPIVAGRRVELSHLDAGGAREMFIRHGLVEGDWPDAPSFVGGNREVIQNLRAMLQRARRHDLMVGDEALFNFYDARVAPEVTSGRSFGSWWRRQGSANPGLLEAERDDLSGPAQVDIDAGEFPDAWSSSDDEALALHYSWEPGSEEDGVCVEVPLAQLRKLAEEGLEWQVPGLRQELVVALLRSLPKDLRRHLVPVSEHATEFVAKAGPGDGPLLALLARSMTEVAGVRISPADFDWEKVPGYLRPTFRVVDERGQVLASGKETSVLVDTLRPQLERALQAAAVSAGLLCGVDKPPSVVWDFGALPKVFEADWNGYRLRGYPALVDAGDGVRVQVFSDETSQTVAMAAGARRLVLLNLPSRRQLIDGLERLLDNRTKLALGALRYPPYRSTREIAEDAAAAAVDDAIAAAGGPPWGPESFGALVLAVRQQVEPSARKAVLTAGRIISKLHELSQRTEDLAVRAAAAPPPSPLRAALDDVTVQLAALAAPKLMSRAGLGRLTDVERYLTAVERRLEKLPVEPRRDAGFLQRVQSAQHRLDEAVAMARQEGAGVGRLQALEDVHWMIEELRVSFFAQSLGTRVPVSEERVLRAIERARSGP